MLRGEVKKIAQERREAIKDLLKIMESFLIKSQWFAGEEVTIADFSYLANVATIKASKGFFHKFVHSSGLMDLFSKALFYISLTFDFFLLKF